MVAINLQWLWSKKGTSSRSCFVNSKKIRCVLVCWHSRRTPNFLVCSVQALTKGPREHKAFIRSEHFCKSERFQSERKRARKSKQEVRYWGRAIPLGLAMPGSCRFLISWVNHRFVVLSSFRTATKVVSLSWSGKHWRKASFALRRSKTRLSTQAINVKGGNATPQFDGQAKWALTTDLSLRTRSVLETRILLLSKRCCQQRFQRLPRACEKWSRTTTSATLCRSSARERERFIVSYDSANKHT